MMLKKHLLLVILGVVASLAITVSAQSKSVRFKIEVDGKPIKSETKIILYFGDEKIEPITSGNSFLLPPQLQKYERVNVRFISGKYNLLFESIYLSKFEGEWVIGVDNKPFDKENSTSAQPGRPIKQIYYINFNPLHGDGTRMVVISYTR
jgi:hypothetical protein